jgi:hypothetical protein
MIGEVIRPVSMDVVLSIVAAANQTMLVSCAQSKKLAASTA